MKLDKRVVRNTQSVVALHDFLLDVTKNPTKYIKNEKLLETLKSQGGLARYENDDLIRKTSINTLKRIAADSIPGGYRELDRLRRAALDAISRQSKAFEKINNFSKDGLQKKVQQLKNERQSLLEDLTLLTSIFEASLRQSRDYAGKADEATTERCRREQRELLAKFSLVKYPININGENSNAQQTETLLPNRKKF